MVLEGVFFVLRLCRVDKLTLFIDYSSFARQLDLLKGRFLIVSFLWMYFGTFLDHCIKLTGAEAVSA